MVEYLNSARQFCGGNQKQREKKHKNKFIIRSWARNGERKLKKLRNGSKVLKKKKKHAETTYSVVDTLTLRLMWIYHILIHNGWPSAIMAKHKE